VSAVDCHSLRPLIGAFVLGGLEAEEAEFVRAHLAACPGCAAEHSRLAPLPGLITLASGAEEVTADPPSAALEERLLDAVAHETPARRRRRPRLGRPRAWIAVGAATAVAASAAAGVVISRDHDSGYGVTLRAAAGAPPAATGGAKLQPVAGGTAMHVWVKGLPRDSHTVYEVRCDAPHWSASAGTFRVGTDGTARVVLTTAARRGQYDAIRIVRRSDNRVMFWAGLI
jgi:anti-sigma factor RsiW